jgi:hypothetical protein
MGTTGTHDELATMRVSRHTSIPVGGQAVAPSDPAMVHANSARGDHRRYIRLSVPGCEVHSHPNWMGPAFGSGCPDRS